MCSEPIPLNMLVKRTTVPAELDTDKYIHKINAIAIPNTFITLQKAHFLFSHQVKLFNWVKVVSICLTIKGWLEAI